MAELVRETALEQLDEEVPYSVACEVEEFREGRTPVYIRTVLYVERESQKRILIGAGGQRIRDIGRAARSQGRAARRRARLSRPVGEGPSQLAQERQRAPALRLPAPRRPLRMSALPAAARHPRVPEVQGRRSSTASGAVAASVTTCRLRYPVRDDIPIMLLDEATPI